MSIESIMPSSHLILCHPLLFLSSIFPSIRVFSNESVLCIRWPKYCSFNSNPSNEHSRLISFRIDWLDLLAIQQTLKRLLQHHSSKALILWYSAFSVVQLSHSYMTTGRTIAQTKWTFSTVWKEDGWNSVIHYPCFASLLTLFMLKERQWSPNEVTYAKSYDTKLKLKTYSFGSSRNKITN